MSSPLAIDLFCGLGGWTEGLLAEGWDVIGFDIEVHVYGGHRYPAQLVVQDVLTLNGAQFWDADLIVASPPCQEYSYMAMSWTRAKQIAAALRDKGEFPEGYKGSRTLAELNALFDACFRIQREACEAAGRHIPMVVENVRGAQPWVGRARWNFGSYYLWGDVPALMPLVSKTAPLKHGIAHRPNGVTNFHGHKMPGSGMSRGDKMWGPHAPLGQKNPGFRFDGSGRSFQSESVERHTDTIGYKSQGMNWSDQTKRGQDFTRIAGNQAIKNNGGSWFNPIACAGGAMARYASKSHKRKFASAMIAKIPLPLSRHIAVTFK